MPTVQAPSKSLIRALLKLVAPPGPNLQAASPEEAGVLAPLPLPPTSPPSDCGPPSWGDAPRDPGPPAGPCRQSHLESLLLKQPWQPSPIPAPARHASPSDLSNIRGNVLWGLESLREEGLPRLTGSSYPGQLARVMFRRRQGRGLRGTVHSRVSVLHAWDPLARSCPCTSFEYQVGRKIFFYLIQSDRFKVIVKGRKG